MIDRGKPRRWTEDELDKLYPNRIDGARAKAEPKPTKYRNEPETVDGHWFQSKREANRYRTLRTWYAGGAITEPELQPKFRMEIDGVPVRIRSKGYPNGRQATYSADFRYTFTDTGEEIVEDAKGMDTPRSRLARAVVEAQFGIKIVLV